jgi:hypothetical protein
VKVGKKKRVEIEGVNFGLWIFSPRVRVQRPDGREGVMN